MAIIGFVFLLIVGGCLVIAGIYAAVLCSGFSGKNGKEAAILVVTGIVLLVSAWMNKPFDIAISVT